LEKALWKDESLKHMILSKINELLDCVQALEKSDFFEIIVKHKNGELITETSFSENKNIATRSTIER
jgi:hypothetical protein